MKTNLANFLFEAATLKRLHRTGWQILEGNRESIAEHSFMVSVIGYVLAGQLKANKEKVLLMALFHDFAESRTGDVYKLSDLYVEVDETKAIADASGGLSFRDELVKITSEYEKKQTLESRIVHDADILALCVELKQLMEKGHQNAKEWYNANLENLKLDVSRQLGRQLSKTNSQDWWKKERDQIHKSYKSDR